ncbi:hypothetical protein MFRU_004g00320 [Monilinia fructicola]|nr:hypothetical protein MFRU_004g00320 [Monilinia fructicola]
MLSTIDARCPRQDSFSRQRFSARYMRRLNLTECDVQHMLSGKLLAKVLESEFARQEAIVKTPRF